MDALLGDDGGGVQARLRRDAGRQLGGPHDPAPDDPARDGGGGGGSGPLARCAVRRARARRIRPGRDDKVLADWNGLAIAALARAAAVFDRPEWLARAEEAQDFILAEMSAPDGRVQHAWRLGRVTAAGLLDDQASMARASLALYEATGEAAAAGAGDPAGAARREAAFADGQGGYYTTAADAADVPLARPRTAADNATPAGNGLLAEVFARLWHLTGDCGMARRGPRRCCGRSPAIPISSRRCRRCWRRPTCWRRRQRW